MTSRQIMVAEQRALSERIERLTAFILGDKFKDVSRAERSRLVRQLGAMELYDHVLLERITACESAA